MILSCPSRYPDALDPLVKSFADGSDLVILMDGSGSWGNGAEAAHWFKAGLASELEKTSAGKTETVLEILADLVPTLPSSMIQGDFGWGFSFCSILTRNTSVEIAISGIFSCTIRKGELVTALHVPRRLVDQFVEQGQIKREEAEKLPHAQIILEPLFEGVTTSFIRRTVADLQHRDAVFVGHAKLHAVLESFTNCETFSSANELRDLVEKAGGRSAPTAILTIEDHFGVGPG